jgi:hypothetical protein
LSFGGSQRLPWERAVEFREQPLNFHRSVLTFDQWMVRVNKWSRLDKLWVSLSV